MLSTIAEIIRDLLAFLAVMLAVFIVPLVVISKMPDDNPLKGNYTVDKADCLQLAKR